MREDAVHQTADELVKDLDEAGIPYAIVGALALAARGYERVTNDVDVLLTREGLVAFKARFLGRGYLEVFPGSKAMRNTRHNVKIDVLIAGDYPGDGKPKPIQFPDPALVAERGGEYALLPVPRQVELKLASGMTGGIHRSKDLSDVVEWIKYAKLTRELAGELDEFVRAKYLEIWDALQTPDPIDGT